MRRRHIIYGTADSGYVAPVSRHWTLRGATEALRFYMWHTPPGVRYHLITRPS